MFDAHNDTAANNIDIRSKQSATPSESPLLAIAIAVAVFCYDNKVEGAKRDIKSERNKKFNEPAKLARTSLPAEVGPRC